MYNFIRLMAVLLLFLHSCTLVAQENTTPQKGNKQPTPSTSYTQRSSFNKDIVKVLQDGKWGFSYQSGAVIHPPIFDEIFPAPPGAKVKIGNQIGYINQIGQLIVPVSYDKVSFHHSKRFFSVHRAGKKGTLDLQGKPLLPIIYDQLNPTFKGGFIVVEKQGKKGVYTIGGKEVIPTDYDEITNIGETMITSTLPKPTQHPTNPNIQYGKELKPVLTNCLLQQGKQWHIWQDGQITSTSTYDQLLTKYFRSHQVYLVEKEGKWGAIDKTGKVVIPIIHDTPIEYIAPQK